MASSSTVIRTLQTIVDSRSYNLIYTSRRTLSSWIPPSNRKAIQRGRRATQEQQRRVKTLLPQVNNKLVTAHGKSSFRSQEQQRQTHQIQYGKSEAINTRVQTYESDLVVVLDMDECLIHSQFFQGPGAQYAHQVQRKGSSSFARDGTSKTVDTFDITLPDGERVVVHERPHLHEFLKEVSSKYETHIFTAAMEVYAKPVLKVLDPHGEIFSGIWYRESCELDSNVGAYVKNLSLFCDPCDDDDERQQRLNRTVLVDNNPLSFLANPEHGILVSSFYDDHRDTTLPAVLDLLHELDGHKDVRPVLDAKFRLRQNLDDILRGRPFSGRMQQINEQQSTEQPNIAIAT